MSGGIPMSQMKRGDTTVNDNGELVGEVTEDNVADTLERLYLMSRKKVMHDAMKQEQHSMKKIWDTFADTDLNVKETIYRTQDVKRHLVRTYGGQVKGDKGGTPARDVQTTPGRMRGEKIEDNINEGDSAQFQTFANNIQVQSSSETLSKIMFETPQSKGNCDPTELATPSRVNVDPTPSKDVDATLKNSDNDSETRPQFQDSVQVPRRQAQTEAVSRFTPHVSAKRMAIRASSKIVGDTPGDQLADIIEGVRSRSNSKGSLSSFIGHKESKGALESSSRRASVAESLMGGVILDMQSLGTKIDSKSGDVRTESKTRDISTISNSEHCDGAGRGPMDNLPADNIIPRELPMRSDCNAKRSANIGNMIVGSTISRSMMTQSKGAAADRHMVFEDALPVDVHEKQKTRYLTQEEKAMEQQINKTKSPLNLLEQRDVGMLRVVSKTVESKQSRKQQGPEGGLSEAGRPGGNKDVPGEFRQTPNLEPPYPQALAGSHLRTPVLDMRQEPLLKGANILDDFLIVYNSYREEKRRVIELELLQEVEVGCRRGLERGMKVLAKKYDIMKAAKEDFQRRFQKANTLLCKERLIRFFLGMRMISLQEENQALKDENRKLKNQLREKEINFVKLTKDMSTAKDWSEKVYDDFVRIYPRVDRGMQTMDPATVSKKLKDKEDLEKDPGKVSWVEFVAFTAKIMFFLVREGHTKMIKECVPLLQSIAQKDDQGNTVLSICCKERKPDLLRYFLSDREKWGGAKMLTKELNDGGILNLAVQAGFGQDIVEKLLAANADPNFKCKSRKGNFETPLVYAVTAGNDLMVKILLNAKTDPDCCYQISPVRWAVRTENQDMIRLLIRADADIITEERKIMMEAGSEVLKRFLREIIKQEKARLGFLMDQDDGY